MDGHGDPQILNAQLQSILDMANKTFSADQSHLLAQEIQRTASDAPEACPSTSRKRKVSRCDGTNCGPTSSSTMKRRIKAPDVEVPFELQAGRFMCTCRQWVSLRDESGFTLAPWVSHLLVCGQSRNAGTTSKTASTEFAEGSTRDDSQEPSSSAASIADPPPKPLSRASLVTESGHIVASPISALINNAGKAALADSTSQVDRAAIHSVTRVRQSLSMSPRETPGSKRRRPNRTEAERIQEFHADPQVADVEPYRVLCAICNKWIKLRKNSRYCSIPWDCHKTSCNRNHEVPNDVTGRSSAASASISRESQSHLTAVDTRRGTGSPEPNQWVSSPVVHPSPVADAYPLKLDPDVPPPSVHPSLQAPTAVPPLSSTKLQSPTIAGGLGAPHSSAKEPRRGRLVEAEHRRAALQADPHTEVVEPDRILCSLCKKWVKLRPNSTYCSAPWQSHIQRCVTRSKRQETATATSIHGKSLPILDTQDGLAGSSSMYGRDDSVPEMSLEKPRSSYYRDAYEGVQDACLSNIQPRTTYYRPSLTPVLQDMSTSGLLPTQRRGRPRKNGVAKPKSKHFEEGSDSQISYESEEA